MPVQIVKSIFHGTFHFVSKHTYGEKQNIFNSDSGLCSHGLTNSQEFCNVSALLRLCWHVWYKEKQCISCLSVITFNLFRQMFSML